MDFLDSSRPSVAMELRAAYAQSLVTKHLLEKYQVNHEDANSLPVQKHVIEEPQTSGHGLKGFKGDKTERICIIGAGAAGLATAINLHKCEFYNIDILEASDQPGGRLYTYEFPDRGDGCKNNFCDIGAMRIPHIPRMEATLKLIHDLDVPKQEYYYNLKDHDSAQTEKIVPSMWWFRPGRPQSPEFVKTMENLLSDCKFMIKDPHDEKKQIPREFKVAYEDFMSQGLDTLSTRSYLLRLGYTYEETLHAELATSGRNGSFDQALLETVCDYLDFQVASSGKWSRIEGGMKSLVGAMVKKVGEQPKTTIKYSAPVIALRNDKEKEKILVTTQDGGPPQEYDAVFCTTAMPCLERMDISELGLPDKILTGIRSLHYDNSAKVAIKFTNAWWLPLLKVPGGVSATDLPISNIVYPSFDIVEGEPAVLLASYSWSQDAIRMAALFDNPAPGGHRGAKRKSDAPNVDAPVVVQVLKNLAQAWSKADIEHRPTYEQLRNMYVDHHAFSWDHDLYTGGAFALFGPGQFRDFYGSFQDLQCQGKFMICGEAVSVEHAWISGALNSAYNSVIKWTRQKDIAAPGGGSACQYALKASALGGGEGKHPPELSENILFYTVKLRDVVVEHDEAKTLASAA